MLLTKSLYADEIELIPHVSKKAQDSFVFDYAYADLHRAFAIAPGGAWSWNSGSPSVEGAEKAALESCAKYTEQPCVLYATDNNIVFDRQAWNQLWGPYKTAQQAEKSKTGISVGQKFYDLEFTDSQGVKTSISDKRGKVLFVHFWGCWCPSCQYEFTTLIDMYRIIRDTMEGDVEFVVLQAREPISDARKWAKKNGFDALPLSDSGVKSTDDKEFYLKGGSRIADRKVSKVFPSSYVLDKNGIVVFSHSGSVLNWSEYVPFFRDVVQRSGE